MSNKKSRKSETRKSDLTGDSESGFSSSPLSSSEPWRGILEEPPERLANLDSREIADRILEDQRHLTGASSQSPLVEDYLIRFPQLVDEPELVLDFIYNEFLLRREQPDRNGEPLAQPEEYLQRFPQYASALHDQFQLYQGLDSGFPSGSGQKLAFGQRRVELELESRLLADRFEICEKLGEGGFAIVYKGWDRNLKRFVAVKLARFAFDPTSNPFQRFAREAESVARLSHPGILQVYESGESGGRPFIVGQLANGGSLAKRIKDSSLTALPVEQTVRWLQDICEAVDYAHRFGVVHRDIKPANILFSDEVPCIADFGLAAFNDDGSH